MLDANLENDIDILEYLLEQIHTVELYTHNYDEELFLRDSKTKDAVLTRLIAIGEYSNKLSDEVKNKTDKIDWRSIKAARNYYTHVYRGIDWILVWHAVTNELADLKIRLTDLINVLKKEI